MRQPPASAPFPVPGRPDDIVDETLGEVDPEERAWEADASDRHPEPRRIERFLHGELTRAENQEIVRHFLTGCPRCLAVARGHMEPDIDPAAPTRRPRR